MLAALLTACGSSSGPCDDVLGDYRSVEFGDNAIGGDGEPVPAYEYLTIRDTEFQHQHSDVVEVGEWECSGSSFSALEDRFRATVEERDGTVRIDREGFIFVKQP